MRQVNNYKSVAKTIIISATLTFGVSQSAISSDILVPAPIAPQAPQTVEDVFVPAPVPIQETTSYYLRGDLGWSISEGVNGRYQGQNLHTFAAELDNAFEIGVGFGKYFSPNLRGDITLDYRTKAPISTEFRGTEVYTTFGGYEFDGLDLSSTIAMANLYYDFRRAGSRFTPYIGAGIGFAVHNFRGEVSEPFVDKSEETTTQFAAAVMAGASFTLSPSWKIDAHYRFIYMGDADFNARFHDEVQDAHYFGEVEIGEIKAHELKIGLRYDIH